jgi:hypothetical protein
MPKTTTTKPIAVIDWSSATKNRNAAAMKHNEASVIGHWFSFHMLGWPLRLKAEEHH